MIRHSQAAAPPRSHVWLLCLLLFLFYNLNFHLISTGDTIPARLLPFSLLLEGKLYLDGWVQPYVRGWQEQGAYFVTGSRGHWMSSYSIVTPLLVTPLYVIPAWWLSQQPPAVRAAAVFLVTDTMEKLCAALLTALSVGVLYSALRKVAPPPAGLLITLVYALASHTWSISSQALWTHGLTQLSFAFLLWALVRSPDTAAGAFYVGLALAVATANRLPNAVLVAPFFLYFARRQRQRLPFFLAPLLLLGLLVCSYNLYFFGTPLGAFSAVRRVGTVLAVFRGTGWAGVPGLLVSPSRGLLVFMPWTVFALWGAGRLWKQENFAWAPYAISGASALFLLYARYDRWWGGYCFGPRFLTDLLPFLAFFLVPLWPRIEAGRLLRAAFVLTVGVAFWVQVIGAYYYPMGQWDRQPVSVDAHPERIWDWSDNQLKRNWQAGPAPADLYYRWSNFLKGRKPGDPNLRFYPEKPITTDTETL